MSGSKHPLLIVDGYNVLRATSRYAQLLDARSTQSTLVQAGGSGRVSGGATLYADPFERAREALLKDVATYAQNEYDAVIVYDGAQNKAANRPHLVQAGVHIVFSKTGESADSVIERMCSKAYKEQRRIVLVTSDNNIRSTAGLGPYAASVTKMSAQLLIHEMQQTDSEIKNISLRQTYGKMTIEDRLCPTTRAKLDKLLGRTKRKNMS